MLGGPGADHWGISDKNLAFEVLNTVLNHIVTILFTDSFIILIFYLTVEFVDRKLCRRFLATTSCTPFTPWHRHSW